MNVAFVEKADLAESTFLAARPSKVLNLFKHRFLVPHRLNRRLSRHDRVWMLYASHSSDCRRH